jgi:hypothetical protein
MKKIKPTYLLTLQGELDVSPSLSINLNGTNNFDDSPELYFEDITNLLDFVNKLGSNHNIIKEKLSDIYFKDIDIEDEILEDKSTTILKLYFNMFNKDYINKYDWNTFSSIFNLNN